MEDNSGFYVVRKGDIIGIYKNLKDCQDQAGSSVTDPSVSVYKGLCLPKDTEDYLKSRGLKGALYTIPAADVKDGTFGQLVACPFQLPPQSSSSGGKWSQGTSVGSTQPQYHPSGGNQAEKVSPRKRERYELDLDDMVLESMYGRPNPLGKVMKSENGAGTSSNLLSCTLEFDGASKGNPGPAGAGAVLRAEDGRIYQLQEGVGIATNNVAEYRALILGLRHAIKEGFKKIRVQGDSKLVVCQVKGEWKIKHQNMASLCKIANELKGKFTSFQIDHVLREFNSEADGLANLALNLRDGQVEAECRFNYG